MGLTGALTQAMFGPVKPSRRQYIETLSNSDLVTLEDIDRILHTHYARLPDDTRGVGYKPRPVGPLSGIFMQPRPDTRVERFTTLDSLIRHTLDSYVDKSGLQKICQQLGLPATGNRGDLVDRIVGDSDLTGELALNQVNRNDMKKLCVDLKLPTAGTRGDMESRVVKVMARLPRAAPIAPSYEPQRYALPTTQPPQTTTYLAPPPQQATVSVPPPTSSPGQAETNLRQTKEREPPLESIEQDVPTPPPPVAEPPPPSIPALPGIESVVEFMEKWHPRVRYDDESKYEIELAAQLCHKFGDEAVLTQHNVPGGRIDIQVMGIGLELKVPSKVQMQRLIGQALGYQKYYGPNLIVVIFHGNAKTQDIIAFSNDLRSHGIKVFVK